MVEHTNDAGMPTSRRRRWPAIVLVAALVVAAAVLVDRTTHGEGSDTRSSSAAIALQPVLRQTLSRRTQVTGTLGYAGSYTVRGRGHGTVTWLPTVGQVLEPGQVLYRVNGTPVILLDGAAPAYRDLTDGTSSPGADVAQLNHDLVALGYLHRSGVWNRFTATTRAAVIRLQRHVGAAPTGSLPLGAVVFLPTAARITGLPAGLGAPATGVIMTASSTVHTVTVALDADLQTEVAAGNRVSITLPDTSTTTGTISTVGEVATVPPAGQDDSATPTVPVTIRLSTPAAAGHWDQAPVIVAITTSTVANVLAVPVNALVALAGGQYAVEVVDPDGAHRLVPVSPGLFDDVSGLVQVTAAGLTSGQQVAVPAS
jgi:hypothetical protein